MSELKIVLKFRRQGECQAEVKVAAGIRLDSNGLRLINPQTGASEALSLCGIEEMSIDSLSPVSPRRLVA